MCVMGITGIWCCFKRFLAVVALMNFKEQKEYQMLCSLGFWFGLLFCLSFQKKKKKNKNDSVTD